MADELERIYTVPLRNALLAPRPSRAKRAVTEVKTYLARHMKAEKEKIWIDNPVNEMLWERGIQKPPRRIRIRAIKFEDGVVEVSLPESESPKRAAAKAASEKAAAKTADKSEKAEAAEAAAADDKKAE